VIRSDSRSYGADSQRAGRNRILLTLEILILALTWALMGGCTGSTAASPNEQPTNPGAGAGALWTAGMEKGDLSEWFFPETGPTGNFGGDIENSGIATAEASTDFAHTGKYSAKLTITTPNTPTSGVRLFRWGEAQRYPQLYYSAWYYFPQSYAPSLFWNVMQWKSKHLVPGVMTISDPFFTLEVGSLGTGEMYLYLGDDHLKASYQQSAETFVSIPVGRWFHVEAFYRCDGSGAGEVRIWQDGALLWDLQNEDTRYADGDCAWSVNNYSSGLSPSTATIYIDDAAISMQRFPRKPPVPEE